MEYTKGEWSVGDIAIITWEVGVRIIHDGNEEKPLAFAKALVNAHLIAAAPEMYEALNEIISGEDYIPPYMAQTINEAIAKAEGK